MNDAADRDNDALAIDALEFAWPGHRWRLALLHLRLPRGERLFLHGPSGAGKSTLLHLIAGAVPLPRDGGEIRIDGVALRGRSPRALDRLRGDRIGIIFQQFNLLPFLSMTDNVLLPCRFSRVRRARAVRAHGSVHAAACNLLDRLGLDTPALRARPVHALSVGQQQRVAAARALIGDPPLVIADEPTSALDPVSRDVFLDVLFEECRRSGAALLLVSHDPAVAGRFPQALSMRPAPGGDASEAMA